MYIFESYSNMANWITYFYFLSWMHRLKKYNLTPIDQDNLSLTEPLNRLKKTILKSADMELSDLSDFEKFTGQELCPLLVYVRYNNVFPIIFCDFSSYFNKYIRYFLVIERKMTASKDVPALKMI